MLDPKQRLCESDVLVQSNDQWCFPGTRVGLDVVNTDDRDVINFLKIFSMRSHDEIVALENSTTTEPAAREAQKALAHDMTALVHGPAAVDQAIAASAALFGRADLADLDRDTVYAALTETGLVPMTQVDGESIVDYLVATGLMASKSAARRSIDEGGAYLNNERISDEAYVPQAADWLHGEFLLLRKGKRSIAGVHKLP